MTAPQEDPEGEGRGRFFGLNRPQADLRLEVIRRFLRSSLGRTEQAERALADVSRRLAWLERMDVRGRRAAAEADARLQLLDDRVTALEADMATVKTMLGI